MKSAERASLRSLLVLAALAAVVFLAALLIGSSGIGVRRALEALGGSGDAATRSVLLGVRLPRVLAAFGVGSLLALSGVLLQALFRNPLADPYVLGVSPWRLRASSPVPSTCSQPASCARAPWGSRSKPGGRCCSSPARRSPRSPW